MGWVAGVPAADVQGRGVEVDLNPAQIGKLADPQAVAVGDQDHGGIAMTAAVALGGVHHGFDLGLGQVLASCRR